MSPVILEALNHLKISLEDIKSATNNFRPKNVIGRGGFGTVYRGELSLSRAPRRTVAIKRLDSSSSDQGEREFLMEIAMLSSYKHKNLVSLVGFCDECGEKILVYKHEVHGSLDKCIGKAHTLTWKQHLEICVGVAHGLEYLHNSVGREHRVIHRDIKSSNILLDENWRAKISDFGLSKIGPCKQKFTFLVSNAAGTLGYCDPLYRKTGILTKESDVYSFGVVLFEVLCGRLACLNDCDDDRRFLEHLASTSYDQRTLDDIIDPDLRRQMHPDSLSRFSTIAYRCLQKRREDRPTMTWVVKELEDALRSQIFDGKVESSEVIHRGVLHPFVYGQAMNYSDIVESTNNFDESLVIGEGGFGKVYKGVLRNGMTVAVKRRVRPSIQGFEQYKMEIKTVRERRHKNLVRLIGYVAANDEMIRVYEFMPGGNLQERLYGSRNHPTLTWKQRLDICIGVARGLNFLHGGGGVTGRCIIHRDVKTPNILLDNKLVAKLADFGISKPVPASDLTGVTAEVAGTIGYFDPEYIRQQKLTVKSDVYSFGVVLMEVICARPAVDLNLPREEIELATWATKCESRGQLEQILDPSIVGTVKLDSLRIVGETAAKCLADKGNERPSMSNVLWSLEYALQLEDNYFDDSKPHDSSSSSSSSSASNQSWNDASYQEPKPPVKKGLLRKFLSRLLCFWKTSVDSRGRPPLHNTRRFDGVKREKSSYTSPTSYDVRPMSPIHESMTSVTIVSWEDSETELAR